MIMNEKRKYKAWNVERKREKRGRERERFQTIAWTFYKVYGATNIR